MRNSETDKVQYASTRNACKLCSPLGASMVFKGIKGCVPMIHGSQGCATYIRRYMISHFKEPVDIASSNFSEESTVFGGNKNFCTGIDNIIKQYHPEVIGIASTCLSETIGEDIQRLIKEYLVINRSNDLPVIVHASTPSYNGSHVDGFHEAVLAVITSLAENSGFGNHINLFPGFVSPADIRHIKEILNIFGFPFILFPDYSDPLDNPHWKEYQLIPEGGTPVEDIKKSGSAMASIEFGSVMNKAIGKTSETAGELLEKKFNVPLFRTHMPVGIGLTDDFFSILKDISNKEMPDEIKRERGRLVDAYVDAHKYLFGKRAIVYGEEDMVISMVSFLEEIGIETVLAGSGGESNRLGEKLNEITGRKNDMVVVNGLNFETINEMADELKPDIFIGNSKGYYISRRMGKPLIRIGFPVHDRFGAQRFQHLCYKGTQQLFDRIVNALIEYKQENSPVGYKYI